MIMQMLLGGGGGSLVGTFDPVNKQSTVTLSNGNFTMSAASTVGQVRTTSSVSTASYFEVTCIGTQTFIGIGNAAAFTGASYPGNDTNAISYYSGNGLIYYDGNSGVFAGIGGSATNDVIGVKMNADGSVQFSRNNATFSSTYQNATPLTGPLYIYCAALNGAGATLNIVPIYTVPFGYKYWGN